MLTSTYSVPQCVYFAHLSEEFNACAIVCFFKVDVISLQCTGDLLPGALMLHIVYGNMLEGCMLA